METKNRYSPDEILRIFQANYLQQQEFDCEVELDEKLKSETTIEEWRNICDLLDPYELANYFNYFFEVDIPVEKWLFILEPEDAKRLGDLCEFIAENAVKPSIKPVRIFGIDCRSAAVFKYLMSRFRQKGIMTASIHPSTLIEPFAKENLGILIEEVNKINPDVLPQVNYKPNYLTGMGDVFFLLGFVALIVSIWMAWIASIFVALVGLGILLAWLGLNFKPARTSFEGINTFRDLVEKINQSNKQYA